MLAGVLFVPPIADLLDQAGPTWPGFAVALLAAPAVLAADTAHKALRRRTDQKDQGGPGGPSAGRSGRSTLG
jgi:hypothetical protein